MIRSDLLGCPMGWMRKSLHAPWPCIGNMFLCETAFIQPYYIIFEEVWAYQKLLSKDQNLLDHFIAL
jgi:hypothetical protein